MNNLKLISLTTLISILIINAYAQTRKGELIINTGIGLLPTYFMDANEMVTPPIQVGVDYKLADIFSIGVFTGYSDYESKPIKNLDGSVHTTSTKSKMSGVRFGFNSVNLNRWEVYGGFQLAYSNPDVEYTMLVLGEQRFPRPKVREELVYSGFLGATRFVSKRIGVFGEIGYGISLINAGIKTKLISKNKKRCRSKRKKGCY